MLEMMSKVVIFLAGVGVALGVSAVVYVVFLSEDDAGDVGLSAVIEANEKEDVGILEQIFGGNENVSDGEYVYGSAEITTDGEYRYIRSDGLPGHETGEFPNAGNPNAISEQDHEFRVVLEPDYVATAQPAQLPGVALNGIPLEPGTAEFYNRDRSSGWSEEAFYRGEGLLGVDESNAHVQPNGTYHYHAVPEGLLVQARQNQTGDLIQVAWAADGHGMFYSVSGEYSVSYQLKSGNRPGGINAPGGVHDGKYTQDWEYAAGLGDLDDCNGIEIDGEYVYIVTDEFPYIPRCLHGEADASFSRGPGAGVPPGQGGPTSGQQQPGQTGGGPGGLPPQEAIQACNGKSEGASCSFSPPGRSVSGVCRSVQGEMACVPG